MVEHLARNFLMSNTELKEFCIGWWASNTHGSHDAVRNGHADLAVVYDVARLREAIIQGEVERNPQHIWLDRFALVGPLNDELVSSTKSVESAVRNIMKTEGAYWLTRVDKSTANFREATMISRVVNGERARLKLQKLPHQEMIDLLVYQGWLSMSSDLQTLSGNLEFKDLEKTKLQLLIDTAAPLYGGYRKIVRPSFYRPINLLPKQAAKKADELGYYTLSDLGIFHTLSSDEISNLRVLLDGTHQKKAQTSFFLNPGWAVEGSLSTSPNAKMFFDYLSSIHTKKDVIRSFRLGDHSLYESPIPKLQKAMEYLVRSDKIARRLPLTGKDLGEQMLYDANKNWVKLMWKAIKNRM